MIKIKLKLIINFRMPKNTKYDLSLTYQQH